MIEHQEIIFAGFGGQGILSMGQILSNAGLLEGCNVSWLPSYGPEMRGGTANCHVILSEEMIGCPIIAKADSLIAMNGPSLKKFESSVKSGGKILVNSSLVEEKVTRDDVKAYYFPVNDIAMECGNVKAANMVMLGAYLQIAKFPGFESVLNSFIAVMGEKKRKFLPLNETALSRGKALV